MRQRSSMLVLPGLHLALSYHSTTIPLSTHQPDKTKPANAKMCIILVKHWTPCLHMRGRCVEQCDTNLATPGIPTDDCAQRRSVYIHDAEEGECPVCVRQAANATRLRVGSRNAAPPQVRLMRPVRSTRTPLAVPSTVSGTGFDDGDSTTTLDSMCSRGRCDMHDLPGRGMQCMLCGRTIGCAATGSEADTSGPGRDDGEFENPFADDSGNAYDDGEESYANHVNDPFRDPEETSTVATSVHEGSGEERGGGRQLLSTVWEEGSGSGIVERDDVSTTTGGSSPKSTATATAWREMGVAMEEMRMRGLSRNF
ncbi:hypothetical protein LTR91_015839 [Friedmanniomyces endolithicus]|uniref:Uncharacterized protein n=1 Tax=Friedmanniomyces endolithicus TaxID=329885 RepID=A0AAN6QLP2_9PEZI|nr:hypothetical protein LTS00_002369 [Friedmanniomyces endolithicus]KAK0303087.1 hypothetical protein LTR82_017669 [Friedmanniomyces endolithicus]KAK0904935.1 hypothetical protein LTR57_018494 [Friedmanniomyces endolithicus]KAK0970684.1 hypothetical protein LTR91_015839 [Friedmanniomyces endolithicus]KAK1001262.1 hypothetical protein LTS01_004736 [Friedmanniomyces endolithicus]